MIDSPSARLRTITDRQSRSPRPGRVPTIPELALALAEQRKRTRSGSIRDREAEELLGRQCHAATVETSQESFIRHQRVRGQPDQEHLREAQWAMVEAYGNAWFARHQQEFGLDC
jgi:hypothetical protein